MSDREDKKLNLGDELADVKSLIAGAEDGGFSLDDIQAQAILDMRLKSAVPMIFLGACIAAAIMTAVTFGVIGIF